MRRKFCALYRPTAMMICSAMSRKISGGRARRCIMELMGAKNGEMERSWRREMEVGGECALYFHHLRSGMYVCYPHLSTVCRTSARHYQAGGFSTQQKQQNYR